MRRSLRLRQRRASLAEEARTILDAAEAEGRDLTDEERTRFDELEAQMETLAGDIEREERLERTEAELEATLEEPATRSTAVRGMHRPDDGGRGEFRSFGEFLAAVRFSPADPRLGDPQEVRAASDQSMSGGSGEYGGYAVPEQFIDTFLEVSPQEAVVRPRATVIPPGDRPEAPARMVALDQSTATNMYGGVEVSWIAEGAEKPQTDMKIREVSLQPHEVAGHIVTTDQLLRNWAAAGATIERQLRNAILAAEDVAFLAGNGVGKPLGPLFAGSQGPPPIAAPGAVKAINRTTASQVAYADLVAMYAAAKHGGELTWVVSPTALPQLMQLKDGNDNLIWQPSARDGVPGEIFGIPVIINERSPVLGTYGDVALIDFGYYLIKDGVGPIIAASPHVHFVNNKTVIKVFKTVDGKPWLNSAIPLEDGTTTVSPFVVLDVPAGGD